MAGTNAPDFWVVGEQEGGPEDLVGEYLATLGGRSGIYTARVTAGAQDATGNALPVSKTWSFKVR